MSPRRMEAFSDGVLAIAITLLVLGIGHPVGKSALGLWSSFVADWPYFLGYALSFVAIGIMWVNHHALVQRFGRVTRAVLYWNLYLLAWVALIPFTTALLAENLGRGNVFTYGPSRVAGVIYEFSFVLAGSGFVAMWRHLVRHPELRAPGTDIRTAELALRRSSRGPILYLAAAGVCALSPIVGVVMSGLVAASFMFGPETADDLLADAEVRDRRREIAATERAAWELPGDWDDSDAS